MSAPLAALRARAAANPKHIVLSEGPDPRVLEAARRAQATGLARVTVLGPADGCEGCSVLDPSDAATRAPLIAAFQEARAKREPSAADADQALRNPLVMAALMVRTGMADGTIGGAVATTSDTVRAALQMIGTAPGAPLVSSFFLMVLPDSHPTRPGAAMLFSDAGLVIDPDAGELAAIAAASAASARQLLQTDPKVAMLSFSTMGSAKHPKVSKVSEAVALARDIGGFAVDGELQFDAAFVPEVGASKAPGSAIAGAADVFVFPNLDAGNIGYKIAQRIGGATAIGPILQGLAKPANDLSRGCTADDILDMIAVTAVQAGA